MKPGGDGVVNEEFEFGILQFFVAFCMVLLRKSGSDEYRLWTQTFFCCAYNVTCDLHLFFLSTESVQTLSDLIPLHFPT